MKKAHWWYDRSRPGLVKVTGGVALIGCPINHWEYDAERLDGFDYDIGSTLLRSADAANELELLTVLREWQLDPHQFQYAWDTADPR